MQKGREEIEKEEQEFLGRRQHVLHALSRLLRQLVRTLPSQIVLGQPECVSSKLAGRYDSLSSRIYPLREIDRERERKREGASNGKINCRTSLTS